jgi:hypothetical protein
MPWQRPNIGSRMNRKVHVRFWERPEVKFLRATRQNPQTLRIRLPFPRYWRWIGTKVILIVLVCGFPCVAFSVPGPFGSRPLPRHRIAAQERHDRVAVWTRSERPSPASRSSEVSPRAVPAKSRSISRCPASPERGLLWAPPRGGLPRLPPAAISCRRAPLQVGGVFCSRRPRGAPNKWWMFLTY